MLGGRRVILRAAEGEIGDRLVIWRAEDDLEIGFVAYAVGIPDDGWLTIAEIELDEKHRGWGYGSEAVRLLEEEAHRVNGARSFRADVEASNGLGLYFWLRLGYRPATEEEAFWRSDADGGTISMVRV